MVEQQSCVRQRLWRRRDQIVYLGSMADHTQFAEQLIADLEPLGEITSRKMFGGVGIFGNGKMFVIVDKEGNVFLKGDPDLTSDYESAGRTRHGLPYWSITKQEVADPDVLLGLSRPAFALAVGL